MRLMTKSGAEFHPEFGSLLSSRGHGSIVVITITVFLALVAAGGISLGVVGVRSALLHGRLDGVAVAVLGTLIVLAFCAWGYAAVRRRVDFYESGAVDRRLIRDRDYAYQDALTLRVSIVQIHLQLAHVATVLKLSMKMDTGRKLKYGGRLKTKGGFALLTPKVHRDAADELDSVLMAISRFIASRLADQIVDCGSVDWCKRAAITPDGVTPRRGRLKGECVPWSRLAETRLKDAMALLYETKHKRPFLRLKTGAENFHPGYWLCQDLASVDREAMGEAA